VPWCIGNDASLGAMQCDAACITLHRTLMYRKWRLSFRWRLSCKWCPSYQTDKQCVACCGTTPRSLQRVRCRSFQGLCIFGTYEYVESQSWHTIYISINASRISKFIWVRAPTTWHGVWGSELQDSHRIRIDYRLWSSAHTCKCVMAHAMRHGTRIKEP